MTASPNNISPLLSEQEAQRLSEALRSWIDSQRMMLNVFLDAYCIVDLTNTIVEFNLAFSELVGESQRRILRKGFFCELLKTELCPGQCPAKQIFTSEQMLRLDELQASTKAYPTLHLILGGVPIVSSQGELLGALLNIRNVTAESELQKKYDQRKKESVTDGLTKLYNKTYASDYLLRALKMCLRENQKLSVMMCDIDHFKKVNDTFGHQAGDFVLASVAQILHQEARDTDLVGRFGGEEFMAVLSGTEEGGAKVFAERFRQSIENSNFEFEGKKIPVTVSLGTATFFEPWAKGVNAEDKLKELINKADTALYFAKANGRNQTCQFETLPKNTPQRAKK